MNRRDYLRLTGAVGLSVGVAGCGDQSGPGSPTDGGDQQDGNGDQTNGETDMSLIDRAREEGTVTVYSVIDAPDMESIFNPQFKDDYPWANIDVLGLGPADIASKMSSEAAANNVQADVAINTQATMAPHIEAGVFADISESEAVMDEIQLMNYSEATYDQWWAPSDTIPQLLMYNSDMTSSPPQTYEDLADSKWEDKLVFDRPSILNVAGAVFATLYGVWGESKWRDVMEGIAANNPRLTESASDSFRVMAQGEAAVGIGLLNNILGQDEPWLINPIWAKPVSFLNVPIYIANDAPHPAMAELYTRWMVSVSGQEAMAESGRVPPHGGVASYTFEAIPSDVELVPTAYQTDGYYSNPDEWASRFEEIFG